MTTSQCARTPLAIAVSATLLFGCSTDKTSDSVLRIDPVAPQQTETSQDQDHSATVSREQAKTRAENQTPGQAERREREHAALHRQAQQPGTSAAPEEADRPAPDSRLKRTQNQPITVADTGVNAQSAPQPREVKKHALTVPKAGISLNDLAPPTPSPRLDYAEPVDPRDREQFARFSDSPVKSTLLDPLSTFGIDVDSASYALARQGLNNGRLPRPESVRTEEWTNYFKYDYPVPAAGEHPFSVTTEVAPAPWARNKHLLSVGLKGYEVANADLPPLNLTFLIDVSGSMSAHNKLPLAKTALKMLVQQLRPQDRVAITVYAGAAGLVLASTPGDHKQQIIAALDRLRSGGSTAGGAGIHLAYQTARQQHHDGAISRVILLSDGDFNVGTTSTEALKQLVAKQRASGVALSVLSFGRGNIRDELMNSLAEIGNGNSGYIDSAHEARKYLVDDMAASLFTIAKDTKAQIEFNPAAVDSFRLLGYETRHLEHHEFNDDRKDAGEIGAGHAVTALYEITLKGSPAALSPERRYGQQPDRAVERLSDSPYNNRELAYLKLRYKQPDSEVSTLITRPVYARDIKASLQQTSDNFRWAAAVAGAAQKARGNAQIGPWNYEDSLALARTAVGEDSKGYRSEFIRMLGMAASLDTPVQISRAGAQ